MLLCFKEAPDFEQTRHSEEQMGKNAVHFSIFVLRAESTQNQYYQATLIKIMALLHNLCFFSHFHLCRRTPWKAGWGTFLILSGEWVCCLWCAGFNRGHLSVWLLCRVSSYLLVFNKYLLSTSKYCLLYCLQISSYE